MNKMMALTDYTTIQHLLVKNIYIYECSVVYSLCWCCWCLKMELQEVLLIPCEVKCAQPRQLSYHEMTDVKKEEKKSCCSELWVLPSYHVQSC